MSYDSTKLVMITEPLAHGLPAIWGYASTDAVATVVAQNYVTDAVAKGMKVNDLLIVVDSSTPLVSITRAKTLSDTAGTGSLFATGVTIGNT